MTCFPRHPRPLASGPAGLGVRAPRVHTQAWLFLLLALLIAFVVAPAHGATPPNTAITNTATLDYQVGGVNVSTTGAVTVTTAGAAPGVPLPAAVAFLSAMPSSAGLPPGAATVQPVQPTVCTAA